MVRYPDILEVRKQEQAQQDERGHYMPTDGMWKNLGWCRCEKDAHGASEINNANVQPHTFTIYAAKGSQLPKQGEQLRITRSRNGQVIDIIECQCTETEVGILHNRIWAR